jgi:methyl-accepting chemotaxis protein
MEKGKPGPPQYRRRNYFIEKSFQSKFILKFCILVVLSALLIMAALYFLAMQSTTVAIVDSRIVVKTTADFLMPVLAQTIILVTIFTSLATIVVTLFVSHKIAGPLYHFKKALKELADGDFSKDFRIRQLDQVKDLAETFDAMIHETREKIKALKENAAALEEKAGAISESDIHGEKKALWHDLKKIAEELKRNTRIFKI